MIRVMTYRLLAVCIFLISVGMQAQNNEPFIDRNNSEANKRVEDYLNLLTQGYSDVEIFQDLGNANFLAENFETAAFWYEKLLENSGEEALTLDYETLYSFSKDYVSAPIVAGEKDKLKSRIREVYVSNGTTREFLDETRKETKIQGKLSTIDGYAPSKSVTADGTVAYFSKAVSRKPLYGVFSKKETIHEIYRMENVNGTWKNAKKVSVAPKYASAKHPAVSADGKRLFFASNMRGSYGKYDIYVAEISSNGDAGVAKNLGPKVNTKEDELYPNLHNGTLLFFASAGRKGYGGLDLYATQVTRRNLTASVNLGSHINSKKDDYSIALNTEKGMGYVVSNRGSNQSIAQYTVSYGKNVQKNTLVANREDKLNELLNDDSTLEYSSTSFDE